jgi:hypothetical protein
MINKKITKHEKRLFEEEKQKKKENDRVIAKIRYNEWNERKAEEARHKKMLEKM